MHFKNVKNGIWSIKMVLIPCIIAMYRWICLKIVLIIDSDVH
jgi:hypothetical protein